MKKYRLLLWLLIVALVINISGCASKIPENVTETTYREGKKALAIMDDYLSGKIDVNTLSDSLWPISEAVGAEYDRLNNIPNDPKSDKFDLNLLFTSSNTNNVSLSISSFVLGAMGERGYDCESVRNDLYNILNPD